MHDSLKQQNTEIQLVAFFYRQLMNLQKGSMLDMETRSKLKEVEVFHHENCKTPIRQIARPSMFMDLNY